MPRNTARGLTVFFALVAAGAFLRLVQGALTDTVDQDVVALVVVALFFAFASAMVGVYYTDRLRARPEPPRDETAADEVDAALEERILELYCGECTTVFSVVDTGERPSHHTCPGCGVIGVLTATAPRRRPP